MDNCEGSRWETDFRVIDSEGKLYIQREFMVPGKNEFGEYDPRIRIEWYTLSVLSDYNFNYEFVEHRSFEKPVDVLKFWKRSYANRIIYSSVYHSDRGSLQNKKVLYTKDTLMKEFPEGLI